MDLHALADFDLVATHCGFGKAARATGRPKATLSRRVSDLEQELGLRLIERGTRTLRLTEDGVRLHERTHALLAEIVEAGEAMKSGAPTPTGRLRVSAPTVFAQVFLGRIGARYALAYPNVQLEIVAEDRMVDPIEDGYDLVIRIDPSADERLVGRRIYRDERLIVASPNLDLPPFPKVGRVGDLTLPAIMLSASPAGVTWSVSDEAGNAFVVHPSPVLRFSSFPMVYDAVLAGAGVALMPKLLVAEDLASGSLVRWAPIAVSTVDIWALQSSRRLIGAKVRTFLDLLQETIPEGTTASKTG